MVVVILVAVLLLQVNKTATTAGGFRFARRKFRQNRFSSKRYPVKKKYKFEPQPNL